MTSPVLRALAGAFGVACSATWIASVQLHEHRKWARQQVNEIETLHTDILNRAELDEAQTNLLSGWRREALNAQNDWLNGPFYSQLVRAPPFPPSMEVILKLDLPISAYYTPYVPSV